MPLKITQTEMLLVYLTSAVLMLGVIWLIPIVNYASQMFYFGLIVMAVVLGFVVLRRPSREGIFVTLVYARSEVSYSIK